MGVGTLCMAGILLGAVITPLVVYGIVDLLQAGVCNMSGEDRFACTMRHFAYVAISILPGAIFGFVVAYKYCTWREKKSQV